MLEDLGSTNGTFCNGAARARGSALADGDKILLGSTTILKFSYQDQLDETFQRQMSESALRDGLTHAYNKRYFIERLESELQYARPPQHAAVADLPRHRPLQAHQRRPRPPGRRPRADAAGDAGDRACSARRTIFARYGGEEFAIICARRRAGAAADAVASACAPPSRPTRSPSSGTPIPVTISVGVARAPDAGHRARTADLVARADETMYAAKRGGRNRVCTAAGHARGRLGRVNRSDVRRRRAGDARAQAAR